MNSTISKPDLIYSYINEELIARVRINRSIVDMNKLIEKFKLPKGIAYTVQPK